MNTLYETEISDAGWIAYDIPGNVGWIIYIICICVNLKRGLHAFSILAAADKAEYLSALFSGDSGLQGL